MKALTRACAFAIAMALTACSAPTAVAGGPSSALQLLKPSSQRSSGWMQSDAGSIRQLLYVVTGSDVEVYDYADGKLVGALTGFTFPYGSCEDAAGDVWIADFDEQTATEYPHGGVVPVRVVQTSGGAEGCAVDPVTGNLAVMSYTASGAQVIQVWAPDSRTPKQYGGSDCQALFPDPAYDRNGNLFVEKAQRVGVYGVCEVRAGGSNLTAIPFDQKIIDPGGVVWDGQNIGVVDSGAATGRNHGSFIYRVRIERRTLRTVGETVFNRSADGGAYLRRPFVLGTANTPANRRRGTVVIANDLKGTPTIFYWHYPAGGRPFTRLDFNANFHAVASVSIRVASHR